MLTLRNISPYVRVAMHSVIEAPWSLRERVLLDYELILVKSGKVEFDFEGQQVVGQKDDVLFIRPGKPHKVRLLTDEAFTQPHLHFDLVETESSPDIFISFKNYDEMTPREQNLIQPDLLAQAGLELPTRTHLEDPQYFTFLLYEIIDAMNTRPPQFELIIKYKTIELLLLLLNRYNRESLPEHADRETDMLYIRNYITENSHLPITLDKLCAQFAISKSHLLRRFKECFGQSVMEYYHYVRTERAKAYLKAGHSVSEVSDLLGFSSVYTFSRFFKTHTGRSPIQYRRQQDI